MQLAFNGVEGQNYETDEIFYIWARGVEVLVCFISGHMGFIRGTKKKKATLVLMSYS